MTKSIQNQRDIGFQKSLLSCVCYVIISAFQKNASSSLSINNDIAKKIFEIGFSVINMNYNDVLLIRAAGQVIGCAAATGDDGFATR